MSQTAEFSIVLGGPLYRLYRRVGIAGESLELAARRATAVALFCWLPLLLLALYEGNAWGGVRQAFLLDVDVHARLLLALPLLLGAERYVHTRMKGSVQAFVDRGIVGEAARPQFDAALNTLHRLRESRLVEVLLLVLVYAVGIAVIWRQIVSLDVETWYRAAGPAGSRLTLAGWWYALVSLALFQFVLYRWYVRLGMWTWFLWKVSRSSLEPIPAHPDKAAGLGFLGAICYAFWPLLLGHGVLFAGVVAAGRIFDARTLGQYALEFVVANMAILLFVFGPLVVFLPTLVAAKRAGLKTYGLLAERYVRAFDRKWISGDVPAQRAAPRQRRHPLARGSDAGLSDGRRHATRADQLAHRRADGNRHAPAVDAARTDRVLGRRDRFDAAWRAVLSRARALYSPPDTRCRPSA